jgi:ATP-dependent Clp protease protease subunit
VAEPTIHDIAAERARNEAEAELYRVQTLRERHDYAQDVSLARSRRTLDFVGEVTELEVGNAVDTLSDWVTESKAPLTIRLCSPGGSVFDGLFLFDFIRLLPVHVTTQAMGYACSMGSILSQAGDHRVISKNAWYMVHEPASIALGKASDIKDEARLMERLHNQLIGIVAERSHLTARQVKDKCRRKDWWMNADEALEHGFFDEIVGGG